MTSVILKRGRDESLRRFHPWIFSGAVDAVEGSPYEGETVAVLACDRSCLGFGHYQKGSIAVRILSFNRDFIPSDDGRMPLAFWEDRIGKALSMRRALGLPSSATDCYRLVHGEGDSLPGLIVDVYGDVAVLQAHSAGMYLSVDLVSEALMRCSAGLLKAVYNKSSATAPHKAGLDLCDGYVTAYEGQDEGTVKENGNQFYVNWVSGQKTGFFLDQRDNRELVGAYARGRNVLNLFCYTGGFSVYALNNGAASVTSVDSSQTAVDMLRRNVELNICQASGSVGRHDAVCADALGYLRDTEAGKFDLMVVDPPAFAKHRDVLDNALRAYRRLNASAIGRIAPGGLLFTYSCSQAVDRRAFELAVFSAAAQTGRSVRILRRLTQPADHPVSIYHPEGDYLKGLMLYVE